MFGRRGGNSWFRSAMWSGLAVHLWSPPGDSVYDAVLPSEDVAVSLLRFPPTDSGGSMECIGAGEGS